MISTAPIITDAGKSLQIRALAGETITFTGFKVGSGTPTAPEHLTDLVSPKISFGISDMEDSEEGYIIVTGSFDNTEIDETFQWKELGLFCEDEDGTNVLYAYAYDPNGGRLVAGATDVTCRQTISVIIAIGDAEHVEVRISSSALYASKSDFDNHVANTNNPHQLTPEKIGAAAVNHNHNAGDINAGILPVGRGGTGQATLQALRNAMGLGNGSGPLSIENGGTGNSSVDTTPTANSTKMVTSGGVKEALDGKAPSVHKHSAGDINAGTLPVERGGTGKTSLKDLRNALGLGNTTGTLEVENGGTGVTSLEGTDYGTAKPRKIYAGTGGMTHGSSALASGVIYLQYL